MTQTDLTTLDLTAAEANYWRIYHDAADLQRADALRTIAYVQSTGVTLSVDVYAQEDATAPVIIFNHGGGGYSRLFIPLGLELFDRGYTVLFPDQRGQGMSGGSRTDFEMGQFVQNIVDVAHWARDSYHGPLYLAGASLGGALTYMAAAAGAPVDKIVCHNLYHFGGHADTLAASRFAPIADLPGVGPMMAAAVTGLAKLMPQFPLPYQMLGRFDKMVDPRSASFYDQYLDDPYPIQRITMRYMASTFNTPPAVPFAENRLPVLVINQTRDEMVSPTVTRRNYEKLGGPKQYVEIDYGHWAIGGTFEQEWVDIVDTFLREPVAEK